MEESMQVCIVGIAGNKKLITVPQVCLVDQLYDEVIKAQCAPIRAAEELRLVYGSKELERSKRKFLHDYDIQNMGTVFMVVRMRGGIVIVT